jgi:hypothetical protein
MFVLGIPSSHDLFYDHSLMDDDEGTGLFEWERHPPSKKIFNSNGTFDASAWSFDTVDDSEKRKRPIRIWRIYLYLLKNHACLLQQ